MGNDITAEHGSKSLQVAILADSLPFTRLAVLILVDMLHSAVWFASGNLTSAIECKTLLDEHFSSVVNVTD